MKSISRFARNSADTISVTRELKQLGVSIYFEKEGIDTADMGSEMLLSMLGAVAPGGIGIDLPQPPVGNSQANAKGRICHGKRAVRIFVY